MRGYRLELEREKRNISNPQYAYNRRGEHTQPLLDDIARQRKIADQQIDAMNISNPSVLAAAKRKMNASYDEAERKAQVSGLQMSIADTERIAGKMKEFINSQAQMVGGEAQLLRGQQDVLNQQTGTLGSKLDLLREKRQTDASNFDQIQSGIKALFAGKENVRQDANMFANLGNAAWQKKNNAANTAMGLRENRDFMDMQAELGEAMTPSAPGFLQYAAGLAPFAKIAGDAGAFDGLFAGGLGAFGSGGAAGWGSTLASATPWLAGAAVLNNNLDGGIMGNIQSNLKGAGSTIENWFK